MAISTSNLAELPEPAALEKLTKSLAMLDAIMSEEWQYRYFHYDAKWDVAKNECMAKLDTGSGDNYFMLFGPAGVFIKGFAHEASMTPYAREPKAVWPGVLDQVPPEFAEAVAEPAFDMENTTFCIWRRTTDEPWQRGAIDFPDDDSDPDGSEEFLWMLDGNPETYVTFAADYYEQEIPRETVSAIYAHTPLTAEMCQQLNPEISWQTARASAEEIGYPLAG